MTFGFGVVPAGSTLWIVKSGSCDSPLGTTVADASGLTNPNNPVEITVVLRTTVVTSTFSPDSTTMYQPTGAQLSTSILRVTSASQTTEPVRSSTTSVTTTCGPAPTNAKQWPLINYPSTVGGNTMGWVIRPHPTNSDVFIGGAWEGIMTVTNQTYQGCAGGNLFIARLDGTGTPKWVISQNLTGTSGCGNKPMTMKVTADGNYVWVGGEQGSLTFELGGYSLPRMGSKSAILFKLDAQTGEVVFATL